jgi:hypothetical protein
MCEPPAFGPAVSRLSPSPTGTGLISDALKPAVVNGRSVPWIRSRYSGGGVSTASTASAHVPVRRRACCVFGRSARSPFSVTPCLARKLRMRSRDYDLDAVVIASPARAAR